MATRGRTALKGSPRGVKVARRGVVSERLREGLGVLMAVAAVYLLVVLVTFNAADPSLNNAAPVWRIANWGGQVGAYVADLLYMLFGLLAFAWVMWLGFHALALVTHQEDGPSFSLQAVTVPLFFVAGCTLAFLWGPLPEWPVGAAGFGNGGLLGKLAASLAVPLLGKVGTVLLMGALFALSMLWFTGWTLAQVKATAVWAYKVAWVGVTMLGRFVGRFKFKLPEQMDLGLSHPVPKRPKPLIVRAEDVAPAPSERVERERQSALPLGLAGEFELPPLELLDEPPEHASEEDEKALEQNARRIEAELKNFGVEGVVTNIRPGPVITIYELEPAAGVKTNSIVNLQEDLARAMSAVSIRIAPIPGRNVLGIEVPNRTRATIGLKELLATDEFEHHAGKLTVAMGVDTGGVPVFADISKMPHALIAGTTGSGKSVGINAFILSLLYRLSPDEVRFIMIDPKMLELSIYNDIPHLLTPVITDPTKAATALTWVVKEMENRYRLMSEMGVKNLASFNAKFLELQAEDKIPSKMVQVGFDLQTGEPKFEEQPLASKPLPHIVVVIDELADLMMVAGKAVEFSIARLTQMARASGIHLLVATQRPSVDVVTGLIKANIPTRLSFSVASKIDSRTVLDSMGAEALLGKGDMLYLGNGSGQIVRLHGPFVSEEECTRVAQHLKEQAEADYVDDVMKGGAGVLPKGANGGVVAEEEDGGEMFNQAVEIVAKEGKASTSFLQRQLKIGYNRAADLIDKMEAEGMISAPNHVGRREVLVKR
ncbi:MAG: DNA translocase FtsK 4TM domain-containing protein [Pseudomonadaceae bacterium]|nr:DNA translocase FtsK 4TM domain-containing protein [Pseudomonadaceae bacterium]